MASKQSALILIDGEHYPSVVIATIAQLQKKYQIKAALLLGGDEKLQSRPHYGVPLEQVKDNKVSSMLAVADQYEVDLIIDLSDEPILTPIERFQLINHALAAGYAYLGADFFFSAPKRFKISVPTLAVVAIGKRVGKTSISNYISRLIAEKLSIATMVLAMGRGGPLKPEIAEGEIGVNLDDLIARAEKGQHAASDFLEDAVLAGVNTIGCVRCGGGMFGAPFFSNVVQGKELAEKIQPTLLILEGSGSSFPPIAADKTVLLIPASMSPDTLFFASEPYRVLRSDLIIMTRCELPFANEHKIKKLTKNIGQIKPAVPILRTVLRPKPTKSITNKRVVYFTTAPESIHAKLADYLMEKFGSARCQVVGSLSQRTKLNDDLIRLKLAEIDIFLIEIKAAAIDTVARFAKKNNKNVVLCDNVPISLQADNLFDVMLLQMTKEILAYE